MTNQALNLKPLRIFIQVAKYLSITAAAEALNMPKSAVSKAISQLEKSVGSKLLERSTRVVRLTETGALLQQRAQVVLSDVENLYSDIQQMNTQVSGTLNIAAAPAFGRFISRSLLPEFQKKWPKVNIALTLSYSYENLFEKGIDVAFRYGNIGDDRLIAKKLGVSQRIIVASPNYLKRASAINSPQDLRQHDCLILKALQELNQWTVTDGKTTEVIAVSDKFQCADLDALKFAAINDLGLAQLPVFTLQDELAEGLLVPVLPNWTTPELPLSVVYRENINKPPKLSALIDFIDAHKDIFQLAKGQKTTSINHKENHAN